MKKFRLTTPTGVWTSLFVCAIIAMAATWTMAKPDNSVSPTAKAPVSETDDLSKAILAVSNMSCGGCVDTITKSLAALPGIDDVFVDIAAGTAEVMFDPVALQDHQKIATNITDAGYPAKISRIYSAQEVRREMEQAVERAKSFIASVGRIDIPRKDYSLELGHARKRYEQIYGRGIFDSGQGRQLLQRLKSQIALRLIDEGIKLQEVSRVGYTVSEETIDQAFNKYLLERKTTSDQFIAGLKANGYPYAYFREKFSRKILLHSYLDNKILSDSVDADAREQQYNNWLANARLLAKVTYYDKELEALIKDSNGNACSGAGNCSGSK